MPEGTISRPIDYVGILFIGDPHVAHRPPGWRKDDYARTVLGKLRWCLQYALEHRLLPVLLGDLFDSAHNNANWVLVELIRLFRQFPWGIHAVVGNHDRREDHLSEHDSLSVLVEAGCVRLLEKGEPWAGVMNGTIVLLGGSGNDQWLPRSYERRPTSSPTVVFWVSHHNIGFPGYEFEKPIRCCEIPGVDLVVNGHIHRAFDDVVCGSTRWMNPGSIVRLARSEAAKAHRPSVLRIDVSGGIWAPTRLELPHAPFDEVFHPETYGEPVQVTESVFVRELATLQSLRTATGAGLREFLDSNLSQFEPVVAVEIRSLADEVLKQS